MEVVGRQIEQYWSNWKLPAMYKQSMKGISESYLWVSVYMIDPVCPSLRQFENTIQDKNIFYLNKI